MVRHHYYRAEKHSYVFNIRFRFWLVEQPPRNFRKSLLVLKNKPLLSNFRVYL